MKTQALRPPTIELSQARRINATHGRHVRSEKAEVYALEARIGTAPSPCVLGILKEPDRSTDARSIRSVGLAAAKDPQLMPHAKCTRCSSRVWCDPPESEWTVDLCPDCGDELQPVSDLSDLVGLRALRVRPPCAQRDSADQFDRISQQIRETVARHRAERQPPADRHGP